MKVTKFKEEMASLSKPELMIKLEELRRELFSMRLQAATQPIPDVNQFKKLRRNIARILTHLNIES